MWQRCLYLLVVLMLCVQKLQAGEHGILTTVGLQTQHWHTHYRVTSSLRVIESNSVTRLTVPVNSYSSTLELVTTLAITNLDFFKMLLFTSLISGDLCTFSSFITISTSCREMSLLAKSYGTLLLTCPHIHYNGHLVPTCYFTFAWKSWSITMSALNNCAKYFFHSNSCCNIYSLMFFTWLNKLPKLIRWCTIFQHLSQQFSISDFL